jgi:hypothetical protein
VPQVRDPEEKIGDLEKEVTASASHRKHVLQSRHSEPRVVACEREDTGEWREEPPDPEGACRPFAKACGANVAEATLTQAMFTGFTCVSRLAVRLQV